MNSYLTLKFLTGLMVFILSSPITACSVEISENKESLTKHYYRISPEILLGAIDENKTDIFSPLGNAPDDIPVEQRYLVSWSQADYLKILNVMFETALKDKMSAWQLNSISFSMNCSEYKSGFQNGYFILFRKIHENGQDVRIARTIFVDARNKYIYVGDDIYSPTISDWSSIDLEKAKMSAEDALASAETIGGTSVRLREGNACHLSVRLSPDTASYNGWFVGYEPLGGGKYLFSANIAP
jgi:hypothetical protein